ncbi:MAG: hypothetical protein EOP82_10060 [Variovorax sp.]|nr:MAG: hypothetical protein EOP82_10060 [Variovorax sp.]
MNINLKINGKVIPATLIDSKTTRDFVSLLPLTLTMHDLFKRERFGALPKALSCDAGSRTQTYEIGDIVYWAPCADVTIFHRQDGQAVTGAVHLLGRIDAGAEFFGVPGPMQVTMEPAELERDLASIACTSPFGADNLECVEPCNQEIAV